MAVIYASTYDPTTTLGQVRFVIQDVDVETTPPADPVTTPRGQWSCLFTDQEIQIQIDKYGASDTVTQQINLAAADLLDYVASNNALLAKLIRLGDYESDTRQTAKTLRDQADALRAQLSKAAVAGADEPAESIEEEVWDDFGLRRWIYLGRP